jgi:glucosamine-phosphate N-acetyltransferase
MEKFLIKKLNKKILINNLKDFLEVLSDGFGITLINQEKALEILKEKSRQNHHVLVCFLNNKIVGTATGFSEFKFIHSGSKVFHIEEVCVKKEYRKLNIGKKLMEELEIIAKKEQCYKIIADCSEYNADNFYKHCSFEKSCVCIRKNLIS